MIRQVDCFNALAAECVQNHIFFAVCCHSLDLVKKGFYNLNNNQYQFATAMSARSLQYYVIAKRWSSDLRIF